MNKFQLIKTNNSLILVSDEEIKEGDNYYSDGEVFLNCDKSEADLCNIPKTNCKKVLSQSPKLSKEVADEVGWIDVEELAKIEYPKLCDASNNCDCNWCVEMKTNRRAFVKGFQKTQELNQKKYSENDLRNAFESGKNYGEKWSEFYYTDSVSRAEAERCSDYNDCINSLSQWACEAKEIDGVWNVTKIKH